MLRVLIVEQASDTARYLESLLRGEGFETRAIAKRDILCLDTVQQFKPHAILLDYWMPGMSLGKFVTFVRNELPSTQIVLLAEDLSTALQTARDLNVPLLQKPLQAEALYQVLNRITGSGEHVSVDG